jgi:hypothetical protein
VARHGMCELTARHGRGTAWARHAMCESALIVPWSVESQYLWNARDRRDQNCSSSDGKWGVKMKIFIRICDSVVSVDICPH